MKSRTRIINIVVIKASNVFILWLRLNKNNVGESLWMAVLMKGSNSQNDSFKKVFCPVCTACFALSGPQKEDLSRYVSSLQIFANNLLNAQSHVRNSLLSPLALIRDLHPFSVSLIKTTAFMTFLGEYKHFESPRTDHAHKTNRFWTKGPRDTPFTARSRLKPMRISYP